MSYCRIGCVPPLLAAMLLGGAWSGAVNAAEAKARSFPSGEAYAACVLDARSKSTGTGMAAVEQAIAACRKKADSFADDLFEAFDENRRADFYGTKARLISEMEKGMATRLAALFP